MIKDPNVNKSDISGEKDINIEEVDDVKAKASSD